MKLPKLQAALRSAKTAWASASERFEKAGHAAATAKDRLRDIKARVKGLRKELKLARKNSHLLAVQKKAARKLLERAAQATNALEKKFEKAARKLAVPAPKGTKGAKTSKPAPAAPRNSRSARPASRRRAVVSNISASPHALKTSEAAPVSALPEA